jgi:hypothetical protein
MVMVTEYPPIRIVSPAIRLGNGTNARLRAPGRGRAAARHPIGVVGRVVRGQAGSPYRHPSSWRAADDRLCLVGRLRSPLGREGRIRCARESRRFHPCACLPTAHGDQSVGFGAFSLGGREEHLNADRGEPSRPYMAIGQTCHRLQHPVPALCPCRQADHRRGLDSLG